MRFFVMAILNFFGFIFGRVLFSELRREFYFNAELEWFASDLIHKISQGVVCASCLLDDYHYRYIGDAFRHSAHNFPYYKILLNESHDLQSPENDTLAVIRETKKNGCNLYVIFLGNGEQVERFLTFVDEGRVIDTTAKFVMNYDRRLFYEKYRYLWKKFVNVIFVKRFRATQEFDLYTIPFPPSTTELIFPYKINSWSKGSFRNNKNLFPDKTSDLRGGILKVVTFEHMPTTVYITQTQNNGISGKSSSKLTSLYAGLEIKVLETLAGAVNFVPNVYEPENAELERWGRRNERVEGNETVTSYSGIMGEMRAERADVALANLYYTPYHLGFMDLSVPYNTECLTFLTPESWMDNSWKTLILPFKLNMWLAVIASLLLGGFSFYLLAIYHRQTERFYDDENMGNDGLYIFESGENALLYTYGMFLNISLPKIPFVWSIRMLIGWWWLYCILVAVSYRASMTAILANPAPRVTINTLEELASSKVACGGWGEQSKEFFMTALDSTSRVIGDKFEVMYDIDAAIERVAAGSYAFYENSHFLDYLTVKHKDVNIISRSIRNETNKDKTRGHVLHIMSDCVINMPVSVGLRRNSPLKPRFNAYLRRIVEAGLVRKWLDDVMHITRQTRARAMKDNEKALMNLNKLYGIIVVLAFGYVISAMVLVGEIIHWRMVPLKDPSFDVYDISGYYERKKMKKVWFSLSE